MLLRSHVPGADDVHPYVEIFHRPINSAIAARFLNRVPSTTVLRDFGLSDSVGGGPTHQCGAVFVKRKM